MSLVALLNLVSSFFETRDGSFLDPKRGTRYVDLKQGTRFNNSFSTPEGNRVETNQSTIFVDIYYLHRFLVRNEEPDLAGLQGRATK